MTGRKKFAITERQFEVLRILWEHGPLTVRSVREHMPREEEIPYTTVLGLLQNMEKAGLVTHDAEKQTHRYRPRISRDEATGTVLADFLGRFFQNSAQRLVLSLLDTQHLSPTDLREIEEKLAATDLDKPERSSRSRRKS